MHTQQIQWYRCGNFWIQNNSYRVRFIFGSNPSILIFVIYTDQYRRKLKILEQSAWNWRRVTQGLSILQSYLSFPIYINRRNNSISVDSNFSQPNQPVFWRYTNWHSTELTCRWLKDTHRSRKSHFPTTTYVRNLRQFIIRQSYLIFRNWHEDNPLSRISNASRNSATHQKATTASHCESGTRAQISGTRADYLSYACTRATITYDELAWNVRRCIHVRVCTATVTPRENITLHNLTVQSVHYSKRMV